MPVSKHRKNKRRRSASALHRRAREVFPNPAELSARCADASRALDATARRHARAAVQEMVDDAWESPPRTGIVALAMKTLGIYPDHADAFVILAQHAPTPAERLAFWEAGVAAGERDLGPECFRDDAGHFWGILETRPYMRARGGLALALASAGRRDEAIEHAFDMLRLNPSDNQGVRYPLIGWLLAEERDEEIKRIAAMFPTEIAPQWTYARALHAFRRGEAEADAVLADAIVQHERVPVYLLGRARLPAQMPATIEVGGETEAIEVAFEQIEAWRATDGALAWLARVFDSDEHTEGDNEPIPAGLEDLFPDASLDDIVHVAAATGAHDVTELIRRAFVLSPTDEHDEMLEDGLLDPSDSEHRMIIISGEHPEFAEALARGDDTVELGDHIVNPHLHLALHALVGDQLWDDDPPELWTTVVRLAGLGYERHDILHMLCFIAGGYVTDAVARGEAVDHERLVKELDTLPESWELLADPL